MIVRNKEHLERIMPSAVKLPCFHCDKPIQKSGPIFMWNGSHVLVMHMMCFADWMRRASRDLFGFFGVNQ